MRLATRIIRTDWLPQGPRFAATNQTDEMQAFGTQGSSDHARWLATLMIQDLADCFRASIAFPIWFDFLRSCFGRIGCQF